MKKGWQEAATSDLIALGERTGMRKKSVRKQRTRFLLETLEHRQLLASDVFISEIGATNDNVVFDEDGDTPDWVEIFNAGPDPVNLDGWNLSDDSESLRKWRFPAKQLDPGNFLLVYASDKDRDDPNGPLHANFRLRGDGEYLALSRDTSPTIVEVVSEFAPQYPFQFTDISYGRTQDVTETLYLPADAPARLLLPSDDSLGTSWTTPGFSDDAWTEATASVGYQTVVPGFTVEDAKSSSSLRNLTNALAVLDGEGQTSQATSITPVVNFYDMGGGGGGANFADDLPFPNDTPGDDNDFAIRATGTLVIFAGRRLHLWHQQRRWFSTDHWW